jgi:hypothetical protein
LCNIITLQTEKGLLRKLCGAYAEKEGLFIWGGGEICVNSKITFMEVVMDFFFLPGLLYVSVCIIDPREIQNGHLAKTTVEIFTIPIIQDAELAKIFKF